jgi:signal transduction histidine kinase
VSAITQLRPDSSGSSDLALLFAAFQAFPGSLAVVDSGRVLYANPAWAQMFESGDQVYGRPVEDFIPGHLFRAPTAGQNGQGICSTGELAFLRSDGTPLQLQIVCAAFRVRGGEFQVVSARDTGPERRADTELREAQKLETIGRLTGGVAHDFNNLLTGIMLYCDLLIADSEEDSRVCRRVREMRAAGEQGANLVQQLLAVARPQALESRVFALNTVVTGIQDLLTRLIGENILLTTVLADDLGAVRMDPAHVQQILLNLVLNARDAMPEGGHITLTTRNCAGGLQEEGFRSGRNEGEESKLSPCVELTVTDTGCGMDDETLGRAFEPFFTTKVEGQGSGLGLATAYRLARLEGGTILAESQPGRGTRVSLQLPRVDQAEASISQSTANRDNALNLGSSDSTGSDSDCSGPRASIRK